ncbi:hypothetical protein D3C73_525160 [compost metagenome]
MGLLVEIDQHVAAEDDVHRIADRIFRIHQVHAGEPDLLAQHRRDPHFLPMRIGCPHHIAAHHLRRHGCHHVGGVDTLLGLLQHVGGKVRRQDEIIPVRSLRLQVVGHHHCQRIGLGTGRAGGTPYAESSLGKLPHDIAKRHVPHVVEMFRFAEEVCLVGRDRIDQVDGLALDAALIEEIVAIVVESGDARDPEPAAKPAFEHGGLAQRHLDAAVAVDEFRQRLEIALAELIVQWLCL